MTNFRGGFSGLTIGLALLFASAGAWGQVTAQLNASRTSGVAPLMVVFDSMSSSASGADPIHDLHHAWDFGDAGAGTWAHSGDDKNRASGPWAAHVYDSSGTYTVQLTVTAPNGSQRQATRTITVADPNATYGGSATACVSSSGSFSGCPAGAQRVTESSFQTGASYRGTGKRVLFRRGETFTSQGPITINQAGPGTLGAFGTGPAPRIQSSQGKEVIQISAKTPQLSDWRIMDLDFRGPGTQYSGAISGDGTAKQLLMYRISADNYHMPILFAVQALNYYGHTVMNDEIGLVESSITNTIGGNGGNGVYMGANRMVIMGNSVIDTTGAEHVIRLPYMGRGVISHNYLSTPRTGKSVVKLHALKANRSYSYPERDSRHFIISRNTFQGAANAWSVNLGPQNSTSDERVRDAIVESNYFLAGPGTQTHLNLWTHDVTARNNVFNMNGGSSHKGVVVSKRGAEPAPANNRIYNNTCYTSDAIGSMNCASGTGVITLENNLAYIPNGNSVSGATRVSSNPFVKSSPTAPADFRLSANSQAIDGGTSVAWRGPDFSGASRPTDGDGDGTAQWDLGAFELGGSGGNVPPPPPSPPAAPTLLP